MTIISKVWAAAATIMDANALADAVEEYSADVDLETNGYEAAHITVDVTFGATVEYGVTVSIYGSLDGTNYDDYAIFSQEITLSAGVAKQISLVVKDLAHFRVGVKQGGVVTNDAVVTIIQQAWRYQSA